MEMPEKCTTVLYGNIFFTTHEPRATITSLPTPPHLTNIFLWRSRPLCLRTYIFIIYIVRRPTLLQILHTPTVPSALPPEQPLAMNIQLILNTPILHTLLSHIHAGTLLTHPSFNTVRDHSLISHHTISTIIYALNSLCIYLFPA